MTDQSPAPAAPEPAAPTPATATPAAEAQSTPAAPKKSKLPLWVIILAVLALIFAAIPATKVFGVVLAVVALILGIVALAKKIGSKGRTVVAVVIAAIALILGMVPAGGSTPPAANSPAVEQPGAEGDAPAAEPAETISGGDHIVGPDFAAGQYRAVVKESMIALCSISQKNGDDILDIRVSSEGSVIFTVQDVADSVVSFSGCEDIALAASVVRANPTEIANGDWLVGAELAPGRYSGTVDTATIVALGTITQTNGTNVVDINTGTEGTVILDVADVAGSVVSFSGLLDIQKIG